MNIPNQRNRFWDTYRRDGSPRLQQVGRWITQPALVRMLVALLLLVVLHESVQAAITSTTATINGQTSITAYAGEELPVVVTVARDGGTNWRGTSYRYGSSASWTCVDTTNYDGSGTNSTTLLISAPGSTGSSTLNVRAHTNSSCSDTPSAAATTSLSVTVVGQPTPVANPDLAASCGLDVILVLDESYSIQLSSAIGNVRTAALAFLNGLNNTGSRVAIVEFNTQARQVYGYTVVNDANLTAMTNYVNAGSGSPHGGYDPTAYSGSQYYTNWDDALEKVKALNTSTVAPLVVFVTDGDPTTYNLADGTQFSSPSSSVSSVGLSKAIAEANLVRQQGSHILTVGVGEALNNTNSQNRLKSISGDDLYTSGTLNLATTDVMIVPNFNNLAAALQQVVTALCQSSVTLTKLVDPGTGVYQPASGWKFSASARYPQPSGVDFSWLQPYSAAATQVVSDTTAGDGTVAFQWKPNATTGTSTIVITETQQSGFQLISPIVCTKQISGGSPTSFNVTPSGSSFTISGIEVEASITCQVKNQSVSGFAHAFKFEDLNENGVYDSSELPIVGWPFCINNGQTCVDTNQDGFATFSGLTLGQTVTISESLTGNWDTVMPTSQSVTAHSLVNNGVRGPVSVDIAVNGKPFEVTLVNHTGTTWTYALSRTDSGSEGASHWALGLGSCLDQGVFVSATPTGIIGPDASTGGFYGIKWDPGSLGQYTITLDRNYPEGSVTALVKDGASYVTKYIRGPVCDPMFGNFQTITPAIQIVKSPETQTVLVGDTAAFSLTVTNTGNVDLKTVVVSDPLCTVGPTYVSGDVNTNNILELTETWLYNCAVGNVTADFTNTASVSARDVVRDTEVNDDDSANVTVIQPPDYEISKTLNTPEPVRTGELISFTIRITNTGTVTITELPLIDTYQTAYLVYVGSTPHSDDNQSDGVINWSDLTAAAPSGFGQDLAPDASVAVVIEFVAKADTTALPNGATVNTATVSGAVADPDGPGGVPSQSTPTKSATDDVVIFAPTAVTLASYGMAVDQSTVRVEWQTVDESNIVQFDLYRVETNSTSLVATIPAGKTGQSGGMLYSYTDDSVSANQWYTYQLEVVQLSGAVTRVDLGNIYTGNNHIFLPSISN